MTEDFSKLLLQEIKNSYPNTYSRDKIWELAQREGHTQSYAERLCRRLAQKGLIRRVPDDEKQPVIGYLWVEMEIIIKIGVPAKLF